MRALLIPLLLSSISFAGPFRVRVEKPAELPAIIAGDAQRTYSAAEVLVTGVPGTEVALSVPSVPVPLECQGTKPIAVTGLTVSPNAETKLDDKGEARFSFGL